MAAKHQGAQMTEKNKQLVAPTELLECHSLTQNVGSSQSISQIPAKESSESSSNDIWSGPVLACRPVEDMIQNNDASQNTVDDSSSTTTSYPEQKHFASRGNGTQRGAKYACFVHSGCDWDIYFGNFGQYYEAHVSSNIP
eukprot:scaffold49003_cov60-Attheya_sp.AAC.3